MDTNLEIIKMKKDISYIKEGMDDIKDFIKSADDRYASKEQHLNNKEEIDKLKADRAKLVWIIIGAIVIAVLASLGISR